MDWNESLQWVRELGNSSRDLQHRKIIQHCFWAISKDTWLQKSSGPLNEVHLASVRTCYKTQIKQANAESPREIWLWIPEDQIKGQTSHLKAFEKQCTVKAWTSKELQANAYLRKLPPIDFANQTTTQWAAQSHIVRLSLLWQYGGVFFDIQSILLQSLDPVLSKFKDNVIASKDSFLFERLLCALDAKHPDLQASIRKRYEAKQFVKADTKGLSWTWIPILAVDPLRSDRPKAPWTLSTQQAVWPLHWTEILEGRLCLRYKSGPIMHSIIEGLLEDKK